MYVASPGPLHIALRSHYAVAVMAREISLNQIGCDGVCFDGLCACCFKYSGQDGANALGGEAKIGHGLGYFIDWKISSRYKLSLATQATWTYGRMYSRVSNQNGSITTDRAVPSSSALAASSLPRS